jgi:hypothetical protein
VVPHRNTYIIELQFNYLLLLDTAHCILLREGYEPSSPDWHQTVVRLRFFLVEARPTFGWHHASHEFNLSTKVQPTVQFFVHKWNQD